MRLFVAVRPPDDVLDELAQLPRVAVPKVRWTTRDQWHVTLRFLGNVDEPEPVTSAVRAAVRGFGPRTATIGPRATRLGRDVVALPVHGLDDLAAAVIIATADVGQPPGERPFRGHLSLARTKGQPLDTGVLAMSGEWTVDAVEVIRSPLEAGGARYDTLERCAL